MKEPLHADLEPAALEEIDTPGQKTIAALAAFLKVPESRTAKAVFYRAKLRRATERKQESERNEGRADAETVRRCCLW